MRRSATRVIGEATNRSCSAGDDLTARSGIVAMSVKRRVFSALDGLIKCNRAIVCSVFLWYLALLLCNVEAATPGICSKTECACDVHAHRWIKIKCIFSKEQDMELPEGIIPPEAIELEISDCRELRIQTGAFSGGASLKRVHVSGIDSVVAKGQAFQNISAPNTHLEVWNCNSVFLESHAFRNTRGTLSVSISRCAHVEIKPNAFSWLLWLNVTEVSSLELSSNAFRFKGPRHGRHGPATKVHFKNVRIAELPKAVFPSAMAGIHMDDISIRVIRKDAFCAMTIFNVIISNASIQEIQSGAFSDRALINNLEFVDVQIKNINTAAFRAGHDNFTIQHSRLIEVETDAITITAASVTLNNNEFQHLRQSSIVLNQWNHIVIDRNVFFDLENDAIKIIFGVALTPNFEFSFTDNRIQKAWPGSLRFAPYLQSKIWAHIGNNYFNEECSCNIESWAREVMDLNSSITVNWMMNSSYCMLDNFLKKCLHLPEGYMAMQNFTQLICTQRVRHVECEKQSPKPEPSVSPPSVGPHIYPRQKGFFDMEISKLEELEREKRIIVIVCVVAVFVVLVVILTSGILYMRRRGVCPKLISGSLINLSNWLPSNNGMTAATSARSISRLSVHEYAGLQAETRILEMDTQAEDDAEEDDVYPYTENKATQTLPEELTEEYLRDLQERLNDPDNHSQARDMIEHLYDLIKVEESCNNNNDRQPESDREENAYDVIRLRIRKPRGALRPSVNIGTKAPSLDKLLPSGIHVRPPIIEYAQPRDQRTTDQNLYAELPGDETVPSTSRLSQPILENLIRRAPQPLPPDVVNDHLVNDRSPRNLGYDDDDRQAPQSPTLDSSYRNQSARPMSFLKALGESILSTSGKMNNKRPNSLLCEYAEPSDATAHLYSELSETSASTSKMANRPLPIKPDQDSVAANAAKA